MTKIDAGLTERQIMFCHEYLIDFNPKAAAMRAGYKAEAASATAARILRMPKIQIRLLELRRGTKEALEKSGSHITPERILEELSYIAFFDIRQLYDDEGELKEVIELDEATARAISSVDIDLRKTYDAGEQISVSDYLKKIKMIDKKGALELLGKHLSMFADIIRIEDANAQFMQYLSELYSYLSPQAQIEYQAFADSRISNQGVFTGHN